MNIEVAKIPYSLKLTYLHLPGEQYYFQKCASQIEYMYMQ